MVHNLKLQAKLMIGFAVPLVLMVVVTAFTFVVARGVREHAAEVRDESVVMADLGRQLKLDAVQIQQWLTDIGATRGLDGLDDGFDEAESSYQSFLAGLDRFRTHYSAHGDNVRLAEVDGLRKAVDEYYTVGKAMAAAYIAEGPAGGNRMMGAFDKAAADLTTRLDPFVTHNLDQLHDAMSDIVASVTWLATIVVIAGFAAVLLNLVTAIVIARAITRPINRVIKGLLAGSGQVTSAATQVSDASVHLASGASEQASSMEQTAASLEQMSAMARNNLDNAEDANRTSDEVRSATGRSREAVERMTNSIMRIKESSDQTARIVKTIDEIAFQTNLLALNAAVEAARAGDAGRGFAVVAEEVRNLAQRSAAAARDTTVLIEGATESANDGVQVTRDVAGALAHVSDGVEKVSRLLHEVAKASQDQARGVEEINKAINQIDRITQSNAANAEESASASEELSSQAVELKTMVGDLIAVIDGSGGAGR